MKSARAKKADQQQVSRAELKKMKGVGKLKGIVAFTEKGFAARVKNNFGVRFWNRLVNTSKRRKKTPFVYARTTLIN